MLKLKLIQEQQQGTRTPNLITPAKPPSKKRCPPKNKYSIGKLKDDRNYEEEKMEESNKLKEKESENVTRIINKINDINNEINNEKAKENQQNQQKDLETNQKIHETEPI